MAKGTFIVIDGNDGSGKATQTKLLKKRLEQEYAKVLCVTFPEYKNNFFGKRIYEYLHNEEYGWKNIHPEIASIVYAADRWESSALVKAHLEAGFVVLSDRYTSSNLIHQGGKFDDEDGRNDFINKVQIMEHEIFKIPKPDKIIYLNVPMSISQKLLEKRYSTGGKLDEYEKDPNFLRNSKITGDWLAETQENWIEIDCAPEGVLLGEKEINDMVYEQAKKLINYKLVFGNTKSTY